MAGRPSKGGKGIMSPETMLVEQNKARATRVYKQDNKSDKAKSLEVATEAISRSVAYALGELKQTETVERISLDNTERIKALTEKYMLVCSKTATLPTMSGLARVLGYTRNGLYWHMKNKRDKTSEWLENFRDLCSDLLAQNSLMGNVNPIVSIFLQKAQYGLRDTVTLETVPYNDDRYNEDQEDVGRIMERYRLLLDAEGDGHNEVDWTIASGGISKH